MLSKIKDILKSCFLFWKAFVLNSDKKKFLQKNQSAFKTQLIVLLATLFASFVLYSSLRPAVRGTCRIILQSDNDSLDVGMGRIAGVEAKRAVLGTTLREIKSIGTLKANAEVVIKSEIAGKISEILFTEGSEVKKGDTLIKFEDDLYKAEKGKYEAEYILAKSEYERVDSLYKKNVGSKKAYDEAYAKMQASKAQLESANAQLNRTIIKAPFDGVIGILRGSATPGNIVQQQTELVYLVDNSTVRVEFTVPAKYVDDIAVGQNVEITVDAFKDRVFSGTVDAIDSEIDTRNHSVLVRAIIPNKAGNLKHGMFANVNLVTGEKSDVILIDEDALLREGAIEYVWIIDEKGRAYRKRILSGAKNANGVEVLAGLKAGEIVITTGQLKCTEGGKTKILNKEEFDESTKEFESTSKKTIKESDETNDKETKKAEGVTEDSKSQEENAKDEKTDKVKEEEKVSDSQTKEASESTKKATDETSAKENNDEANDEKTEPKDSEKDEETSKEKGESGDEESKTSDDGKTSDERAVKESDKSSDSESSEKQESGRE